MTCKIQNLTHRIVSIRGNSGETWHIPPGHAITIMTIELTDNEKVRKLEELGFIALQHMAPAKKPDSVQKKNRRAQAQ